MFDAQWININEIVTLTDPVDIGSLEILSNFPLQFVWQNRKKILKINYSRFCYINYIVHIRLWRLKFYAKHRTWSKLQFSREKCLSIKYSLEQIMLKLGFGNNGKRALSVNIEKDYYAK